MARRTAEGYDLLVQDVNHEIRKAVDPELWIVPYIFLRISDFEEIKTFLGRT